MYPTVYFFQINKNIKMLWILISNSSVAEEKYHAGSQYIQLQ